MQVFPSIQSREYIYKQSLMRRGTLLNHLILTLRESSVQNLHLSKKGDKINFFLV